MTTWTLPPEPGPEVTRVRDRFKVRWHREGEPPHDVWRGLIVLPSVVDEEDELCEVYRTWADVLTRGPLTDTSNEEE